MNSIVSRIITILVSLFLIAYVGYQAYSVLYSPIRTERVISGTVQDFVQTDCFILHNETVLTNTSGGGVVDYTRADGERVPRGGTVADVYASSSDAQNSLKLAQIDKKIDLLSEIGSYEEVSAIDINVLDSEIKTDFIGLAAACDDGDVQKAQTQRDSLLSLLNKKQLATHEQNDYQSTIDALKKQRTALTAKAGKVVKTISSLKAGYFSSAVDGYEGAYDASNALSLTPSQLNSLINRKVTPNPAAIGKVVDDYQWYIACSMGLDQAQRFKVGASEQIRFLLSAEDAVPVTVASVNKDNSGRFCVIFSCGTMNGKLVNLRKQTIQIITGTYDGIRVNDDLLHVVGGVKGVYVATGNIAKFKKVDILYSGNGYVVSGIDSLDAKCLQPNDDVITNGENLYDGKIIK